MNLTLSNRHIIMYVAVVPLLLNFTALVVLFMSKCANNFSKIQRLYLLNLSFSELTVCLIAIIKRMDGVYQWRQFYMYVTYFQSGGMLLSYCLTLIAVTVDRVLRVYLKERYDVYMTVGKTRLILFCIYMTSLTYCLPFCFAGTLKTFGRIQHLYFWPLVDVVIIIVVSIATIFIVNHNRRRTDIGIVNHDYVRKMDISTLRRYNRQPRRISFFILPALLMISYMSTFILADVIYFCYELVEVEMSDRLSLGLDCVYFVSYSVDALLYIIFFTTFPRQCKERMKSWRKKKSYENIESTS